MFTITDNPADSSRAVVAVTFQASRYGTDVYLAYTGSGREAQEREATIADWQLFMDTLATLIEDR